MIKVGEVNTLRVLRETDIAYLLTDREKEIFLHKRQALKELKEHDQIDVFLFFDNNRRLTASMELPFIGIEQPGFCKVVDVNHHIGVFVEIGIYKHLLISRDDLPLEKNIWPAKDDELFVKIKVSRNQITGKLITRFNVKDYYSGIKDLEEQSKVEAYVIYHTDEGIVLQTKGGHIIFVYKKHFRVAPRLGQLIEVLISKHKRSNEYNGILIERKEKMMSTDADMIISYLIEHENEMPFTDKSTPDEIFDTFNMSKSAFKRALGTLYKARQIEFKDGKTILVVSD